MKVSTATTYVVPRGQNLVVTDLEFNNYLPNTTLLVYGPTTSSLLALGNYFLANTGLMQVHYTSGLVFPAGSSVSASSNNNASVTLHGYLTAN